MINIKNIFEFHKWKYITISILVVGILEAIFFGVMLSSIVTKERKKFKDTVYNATESILKANTLDDARNIAVELRNKVNKVMSEPIQN